MSLGYFLKTPLAYVDGANPVNVLSINTIVDVSGLGTFEDRTFPEVLWNGFRLQYHYIGNGDNYLNITCFDGQKYQIHGIFSNAGWLFNPNYLKEPIIYNCNSGYPDIRFFITQGDIGNGSGVHEINYVSKWVNGVLVDFHDNLYNDMMKHFSPTIISKGKCIKVFDYMHNQLAEISDFKNLSYGWVLNGVGKCQFDMPLESIFCNSINFAFRNHVEVWQDTTYIWGGQIVTRQFVGQKLTISCYGYLSLLDKRRFRAKSYSAMTYGNLFTSMLADINAISPTGVTLGSIDGNAIQTQRLVLNTDILLTKLQEYCTDTNYDMDISQGRLLNFYTHKGVYKSNYLLEHGGLADNILLSPTLDQNALDLANSEYGEIAVSGNTITSTAGDNGSQVMYGLQEGIVTINNGVTVQSTLDNNVIAGLNQKSYPVNSVKLKIIDSNSCPFSDIQVGDTLNISLLRYWQFSGKLRLLEMTHNEEDGTRDLTVGESIYRIAKPITKIYGK